MSSDSKLIITSVHNPSVVRFSKLKDEKYRNSEGLFLCEGVKLVKEALNAGIVKYLLCKSDLKKVYGDILDRAADSLIEVLILAEPPFSKIATERSPQGIIAVCSMLISDFDLTNPREAVVMCCGVRDPGNLGTIIRTAAGLGFDRVLLSDCADVYNPKTVRASMGSLFRIQMSFASDPIEAIRKLKSAGRRVLATALNENSMVFGEFEIDPTDVFVIGNEGHGLDDNVIGECTASVCITLKNGVESFNAAMAAGIILWEQSKVLN